ncbi:hypothetical protein [Modicisalibacter coralii]|uniref:hypothetical protein n=1 Tax=Modicisalibacter coralii TaxID=2304602 RepID=UPI00100A59FE|nr:hypothetical protein [Halomonas coralii]
MTPTSPSLPSLRERLLLFDDAALEAVGSRGLLRRAERDVGRGKAVIDEENGEEIVLIVDGERVRFDAARIAAQGLGGTDCTCSATGICRHILAGILRLRASKLAPCDTAKTDEATPAHDAGPGSAAAGAEDAGSPNGITADGAGASAIATEVGTLQPCRLARIFGRAVLRDAEALLTGLIETGRPPAIRFEGHKALIDLPGEPTVHYLAGGGPQAMISKGDPAARPTKIRHAAALLALRRQTGIEEATDPPSARSEIASGIRSDFLDPVLEALEDAARYGLATPSEALTDRLFDLALSSRANAMPRLSRALLQVAGTIRRKAAREASDTQPSRTLEETAEAYAIAAALKAHPHDARLRGEVRATAEPLGDLILVGHGLSVWHTPAGARGVTAYFRTLPDDRSTPSAVYHATLARAGGQDPGFEPAEASRSEPVFGLSLMELATSVFRLTGARCGPGGRLSLGKHGRAERLDKSLADILVDHRDGESADESEAVTAARCLHDVMGLATCIRAAALADERRPVPAYLGVQVFGRPWFDPLAQALAIPVRDRHGQWIELTVSGSEDAMLRVLDHVQRLRAEAGHCVIALSASRVAGNVRLTPLGIMARSRHAGADAGPRAGGYRRLLDGTDRTTQTAEPLVLDELVLLDDLPRKPGLVKSEDQRGSVCQRLPEGLTREERYLDFSRRSGETSITDQWIAAARDEALALAELGGRMADERRLGRLAGIATRLETAGLAPLAYAIHGLAGAPEDQRPAALLRVVYLIDTLQNLTPRLPLLVPLA